MAVSKTKLSQTLNLFDPTPEVSPAPVPVPAADHHLNRANLGTFAESLRSPVHRWFTYPAGFSFRAVEEGIRSFGIVPGDTIYDPFAGTATTCVVAKQKGINSFGVEAHPFVQFVAQTKLHWEFDPIALRRQIDALIADVQQATEGRDLGAIDVETIFPELVRKCYSRDKLARLYICREAIISIEDEPFRNFAKLGLTNILRAAADVATGWPYIAPGKSKNGTEAKVASSANILELLRKQLYLMQSDLQSIRSSQVPGGNAVLIAGDSREHHHEIADESIALSFTSPPYLNNYDYSDRTRLETYFWGMCSTWGDITAKVRSKLIMSATTQANRKEWDEANLLTADFCATVPNVAAELKPKLAELSDLRLKKGGKKSYDIMVGGYFNDLLLVIRETYRVLKPGASFVLILGDSAPYGVYIPIDTYLGEIGKAVGFASYESETIRARGDKWRDNPQRHSVVLKECILTLRK